MLSGVADLHRLGGEGGIHVDAVRVVKHSESETRSKEVVVEAVILGVVRLFLRLGRAIVLLP